MSDHVRPGPEMETATLIEAAQAKAVLGSIVVSLLANSFIAVTTAIVLWLDEPGPHILAWIAAVLALNALRLAGVALIRRRDSGVRAPGRTLRHLSAGALAGGVVWAFAPLIGGGLNADGANAYVIFIIGGISAGALMQSTACSRTALLFATPPLSATIASLMLAATPVTMVIAADVLLLAVMMFRASRMSEDGFIRAE